MANGFVKAKELNEKGCEQGRIREIKMQEICIDVNEIGKKVGKVYNLLIANLLTIVVSLVVYFITKS